MSLGSKLLDGQNKKFKVFIQDRQVGRLIKLSCKHTFMCHYQICEQEVKRSQVSDVRYKPALWPWQPEFKLEGSGVSSRGHKLDCHHQQEQPFGFSTEGAGRIESQRSLNPQHVPVFYFSVFKFVYLWLLSSSSFFLFFQIRQIINQIVNLSFVFFCFSVDCKTVELVEALV